ncbi:MAG: beta-ketoacyl-ACP synthase III [Acidimicrobiia bacterium]|nr:MAG: beta-ketoacyl-ACP synthase III [Acidimicrobiia bacterium]
MPNAIITGWGKCVPPAVLSNADLETLTDTSDDWITTRTGIKERRIAHVEVSDMAAVAAQHALAAAGRTADEVDLLLLATCTPDRLVPGAGTLVQAKIGASRAAAMDINAACSGFLFALSHADQLIRAGGVRRVLIIGAEKLSFWLDFGNRSTCVLFGDGAGAVVLEASDEEGGLLSFELGSDGTAAHLLYVPASGTEGNPLRQQTPSFLMEGPEVFKRAVTAMGDASMRVVEKAGLKLEDIDLLIPHQANVRIIDATARRLSLDPAKVFVNIESYGNTSSATIPIAITEALEQGRITPGTDIVFAAFGAGFTWAACVYRWGPRVEPLGSSDAHLPPTTATGLDLVLPNVAAHGRSG